MPGVYQEGDIELVGFGVGVVDRDKVIDGSTISPGDTILGLASSGFHSNGYSLVRRIVEDMGRLDVRDDMDELHGLVTDACLVVTDRAAGWSPDGALPWTWAYLAIRAKVGQVVGHRVV